ncbi:hypothetical protein CAOG_05243 [Capsaspora owczarzaki ATCC 30864]|uniref:hypothetical protein n=1 Tax=Capsaspora owczarzaki (strain ATCC 30864) TaxID=595528 RepID=UPI0003524B46|nr:hypothetical protein CAOG_05243 [Capsaspora owczarzaki ATCC 30864]|eukprot:XP_004346928.2 hypothetical protein CAOG_05243 [Capsaspora owczarzaki ATCC 30864]
MSTGPGRLAAATEHAPVAASSSSPLLSDDDANQETYEDMGEPSTETSSEPGDPANITASDLSRLGIETVPNEDGGFTLTFSLASAVEPDSACAEHGTIAQASRSSSATTPPPSATPSSACTCSAKGASATSFQQHIEALAALTAASRTGSSASFVVSGKDTDFFPFLKDIPHPVQADPANAYVQIHIDFDTESRKVAISTTPVSSAVAFAPSRIDRSYKPATSFLQSLETLRQDVQPMSSAAVSAASLVSSVLQPVPAPGAVPIALSSSIPKPPTVPLVSAQRLSTAAAKSLFASGVSAEPLARKPLPTSATPSPAQARATSTIPSFEAPLSPEEGDQRGREQQDNTTRAADADRARTARQPRTHTVHGPIVCAMCSTQNLESSLVESNQFAQNAWARAFGPGPDCVAPHPPASPLCLLAPTLLPGKASACVVLAWDLIQFPVYFCLPCRSADGAQTLARYWVHTALTWNPSEGAEPEASTSESLASTQSSSPPPDPALLATSQLKQRPSRFGGPASEPLPPPADASMRKKRVQSTASTSTTVVSGGAALSQGAGQKPSAPSPHDRLHHSGSGKLAHSVGAAPDLDEENEMATCRKLFDIFFHSDLSFSRRLHCGSMPNAITAAGSLVQAVMSATSRARDASEDKSGDDAAADAPSSVPTHANASAGEEPTPALKKSMMAEPTSQTSATAASKTPTKTSSASAAPSPSASSSSSSASSGRQRDRRGLGLHQAWTDAMRVIFADPDGDPFGFGIIDCAELRDKSATASFADVETMLQRMFREMTRFLVDRRNALGMVIAESQDIDRPYDKTMQFPSCEFLVVLLNAFVDLSVCISRIEMVVQCMHPKMHMHIDEFLAWNACDWQLLLYSAFVQIVFGDRTVQPYLKQVRAVLERTVMTDFASDKGHLLMAYMRFQRLMSSLLSNRTGPSAERYEHQLSRHWFFKMAALAGDLRPFVYMVAEQIQQDVVLPSAAAPRVIGMTALSHELMKLVHKLVQEGCVFSLPLHAIPLVEFTNSSGSNASPPEANSSDSAAPKATTANASPDQPGKPAHAPHQMSFDEASELLSEFVDSFESPVQSFFSDESSQPYAADLHRLFPKFVLEEGKVPPTSVARNTTAAVREAIAAAEQLLGARQRMTTAMVNRAAKETNPTLRASILRSTHANMFDTPWNLCKCISCILAYGSPTVFVEQGILRCPTHFASLPPRHELLQEMRAARFTDASRDPMPT